MDALISRPQVRWAAMLFLWLGLMLLAGCAASPRPSPLIPAPPLSAREPCEKTAAPDPAAVPQDPSAERVYWTSRDLGQEGALAQCDDRRAALVKAIDDFVTAATALTVKAKPWWRFW